MKELVLDEETRKAMRVWNNCENHPSNINATGSVTCLACGWPHKKEEVPEEQGKLE